MERKKIFLWVQAVLCIALCTVLSLSVILIYTSGSSFTPDNLRGVLLRTLPLLIAAAVLTVLGIVFNIRGEPHTENDAEHLRDLLANKSTRLPAEAEKERSLQKKLRAGGYIGAAACLIPVLIRLIRSFSEESPAEESVFRLLLHILPWVIILFSILSITESLREKSIHREIAVIRSLRMPDPGSCSSAHIYGFPDDHAAFLSGIRFGLIGLAILLIAAGFFNGSMRDVFVKAIRICAECIGLG